MRIKRNNNRCAARVFGRFGRVFDYRLMPQMNTIEHPNREVQWTCDRAEICNTGVDFHRCAKQTLSPDFDMGQEHIQESGPHAVWRRRVQIRPRRAD